MPDAANAIGASALVVKPPVGQESEINGSPRVLARRNNGAADFQMAIVGI